jgi:hypothetical protein
MKANVGVEFWFHTFLISVLKESVWKASPPPPSQGALPKVAFLNLDAAEPQCSAKGALEFRETKICNYGRVLLTVLNLYVRIKNSSGDILH